MKRIAIFCDGTWNRADQPHQTNVRRLHDCVPAQAPDGTPQLCQYFRGVGVPKGGGPLRRLDEKLSGGAMGFGLNDRIAEAWLYLAHNYQPGDQVFFFGYSRGAYTARSLAGLIRNCGLPENPSPTLTEACFAHYRDRGADTQPDAPASLEFRLRHSPRITTSAAEAAFRAGRTPAAVPFRIAYLGIWDTVGALGIPSHLGLPARLLNRKYRFHDTELSSMVGSARHAVALDERRRSFVPTLWDNLPRLRRQNPEGCYLQQWFAGVHGAVGGGGDVAALSCISLMWVADGARLAGLGLDMAALRRMRDSADHLGPLPHRAAAPSLTARLLALAQHDREGPRTIEDLAHPVLARCRADRFPDAWEGRPYRPGPLRGLERHILRSDRAALTDYTAPFACPPDQP